jgi:hypothetical protein
MRDVNSSQAAGATVLFKGTRAVELRELARLGMKLARIPPGNVELGGLIDSKNRFGSLRRNDLSRHVPHDHSIESSSSTVNKHRAPWRMVKMRTLCSCMVKIARYFRKRS